MRRHFPALLLTLLLFLSTGHAHAQYNTPRERSGINLSLWKDVATQRTDTVGSTWLNIGLFSAMNRLQGAGINALAAVTARDVCGVQLSGLSSIVGDNLRGIQVAGVTNIIGEDLTGVSLSGLVNIVGGSARGVSFAGLTNIVSDNGSGLMMGGLLNITGDQSTGIHLAGIGNICSEDMAGVSLGGLLNVTGGQMKGVQLSALGNVVADRMKGVQVGAANVVIHGRGLQIGLINYYCESFKGLQLGLVNANPDTRVQLMAYAGNGTLANVAARFKNRLFYTIVGTGFCYLDPSDRFSTTLLYRAGLELPRPLFSRLYLSGDLGYQHIETFHSERNGLPARLYSLQARLNLEYRLTRALGLFVSGGYGGSRYYNRSITYDKGVLLEGGVVLFRY